MWRVLGPIIIPFILVFLRNAVFPPRSPLGGQRVLEIFVQWNHDAPGVEFPSSEVFIADELLKTAGGLEILPIDFFGFLLAEDEPREFLGGFLWDKPSHALEMHEVAVGHLFGQKRIEDPGVATRIAWLQRRVVFPHLFHGVIHRLWSQRIASRDVDGDNWIALLNAREFFVFDVTQWDVADFKFQPSKANHFPDDLSVNPSAGTRPDAQSALMARTVGVAHSTHPGGGGAVGKIWDGPHRNHELKESAAIAEQLVGGSRVRRSAMDDDVLQEVASPQA